MMHFSSIADVDDPQSLIDDAMALKSDPYVFSGLGKHKTIGLIFFNSSLRTRMSITKASINLGLSVISLNVNADTWQLEFDDGTIMDGTTAEHIREAVPVLCSYCDILAVRTFASLTNKQDDYAEKILKSFMTYGTVPIINMESPTVHPLQSLADVMTITEHQRVETPKVVMTWAPHIKPLPQAVANSFAQWANKMNYDFTITHPQGLELADEFVGNAQIEYDQDKALDAADFVYVKNWSSYRDYGKLISNPNWMITKQKLERTNEAKLMHCLPLRRNVVIADDALDSKHSIVIEQAENRLFTAQAVLKQLLES